VKQQHRARIKITSRSFSRHPVLKQELLEIFPNSVFNTDGPPTGLSNIVEFLNDADGIILGLEQMDRQVLQQLNNLKIIAKYGVGLDNLDVESAKELGIAVGWTGGVNKRSVSEQVLSFMIGMCRNLFPIGCGMKQGVWNKNGGFQLSGKTVGIIGCGHVGSDLLKLLEPFECELLVCDILDKSDIAAQFGAKQVDHDEIFQKSDVLTLHVHLTDSTYHMVNEHRLNMMKPTAYLFNTSRGKVVDQQALKSALQNQTIAGAAIDVYEEEPPKDLEFLSLPNLWPTSHIGGNSIEAVEAMGRAAIGHLKSYFTKK